MTSYRGLATRLCIGAIAAGVAGGCDDPRAVDREVRRLVSAGQSARLHNRAADRANDVPKELNAAIQQSGTNAAKAYARGTLASTEIEAAARVMRDLNEKYLDIARLTYEIGELGTHLGAGNALVAAYRQYEPTPVRQAIEQRIAEAQGGGQNDTPWFDFEPAGGGIPNLATLGATTSRLDGEIRQRREKIHTLQEQRAVAAEEAERLERQSEQEKGQRSVETFTRAAAARKRASDLANQIEVTEAELVPRERDLAIAQAQQKIATQAVDHYGKLHQQIEQGWRSIEEQIARHGELAREIAEAPGTPEPTAAAPQAPAAAPEAAADAEDGAATAESASAATGDDAADLAAPTRSVASLTAQLQKKLEEAQSLFTEAETLLNSAFKHSEEAAAAAESLAREEGGRAREYEAKSPRRVAIETMLEAINPSLYRLGQAEAQQMLGTLYLARAIALNGRDKLVETLAPVYEQASLTMPAALASVAVQDQANSIKNAGDALNQAAELYLNVSQASAMTNDARKNAGRVGRILALYGQVQLSRLAGEENAGLLDEAQKAVSVALENNASLPPLPVELASVIASSTQPATEPATPAPARRPAGKAAE